MLNIVVAHTKKYPVFHAIIVQQSSTITVTFSFIHTGLNVSHKPGPVNLEFHAAVTQLFDAHISVLAHGLAGRCQHHGDDTSGRSISCTSILLNIMVVCNGKILSLVRFHCHILKSFKQLC